MTGCSGPSEGMAMIGPIKRAGGFLPPKRSDGRPAVVVAVDGKSHSGITPVEIPPGPHTIRCQAMNLNTLHWVQGNVGLDAQPNVTYWTKCRSTGDRVEFQIVDSRFVMSPVAKATDDGIFSMRAPDGAGLLSTLFTDDR